MLHLVRTGQASPRPADFSAAFLVVAAVSVLSGSALMLLPRGAGAEMSGARRQAA